MSQHLSRPDRPAGIGVPGPACGRAGSCISCAGWFWWPVGVGTRGTSRSPAAPRHLWATCNANEGSDPSLLPVLAFGWKPGRAPVLVQQDGCCPRASGAKGPCGGERGQALLSEVLCSRRGETSHSRGRREAASAQKALTGSSEAARPEASWKGGRQLRVRAVVTHALEAALGAEEPLCRRRLFAVRP